MTDPLNKNARVAPGEVQWHPAGGDWTVPSEFAEGKEPLDDEDRRLRAAIAALPDEWLSEETIVECVRQVFAPLPIEDAFATALIIELVAEGLLMGVPGGTKRRATRVPHKVESE